MARGVGGRHGGIGGLGDVEKRGFAGMGGFEELWTKED